ncbi:MAG: hypothetical protein RDU20_17060 [Desulfomonilaceae bacterium]|nr:hypothetical protein [Desulfomonilaceae bacterium]
MPSSSKPKAAFFDFACCEGCQLTVLQLEETLLDLLEHVDIVTWREVMTGESESYDVAFCEGSITRERDVERIKKIRETAGILVTLGSCAGIGCHNAVRNKWPVEELLQKVYGTEEVVSDAIPARPITAVVPVDYQVLGCPISLPEFVSVFKHVLTGRKYYPPNQPVCVECKLNDYLCVYEKGMICLGPVTRCGCNAICTSRGDACHGCRGLIENANLNAMVKVFTEMRKLHPIMDAVADRHRPTLEQIRRRFAVYNNWPELKLERGTTHGA